MFFIGFIFFTIFYGLAWEYISGYHDPRKNWCEYNEFRWYLYHEDNYSYLWIKYLFLPVFSLYLLIKKVYLIIENAIIKK